MAQMTQMGRMRPLLNALAGTLCDIGVICG